MEWPMADGIESDKLGVDSDTFYELLMIAHDGLSETESHALNMRLVMMLANEVGDIKRIGRIIEAAKKLR